MYISSIVSLVARGTGAFFGILVTIASARLLTMDEASDFLFCLTIIQSLGGVLCLGTYTAAVKTSAAKAELGWSEANKEISTYFYLILAAYFIFFCVYFLSKNLMFDGKSDWNIILTLVGLMAFSFNTLFSSCWQGSQKTFFANILQNTLVPLIYIFELALIYYFGLHLNAPVLLSAYVFAIWIVAIIGALTWYLCPKTKLNLELRIDGRLAKKLISFAVIVLMNSTIIWSSQYAVATYLGDQEFALFNAAQRLAMLIGIVSVAVNFVVSPLFAKAKAANDEKSLQTASLKGVQVSFGLATPVLIFILTFPGVLLKLFGDSYIEGENLLRILALCQFINIVTGPTAALLTMTGFEKDLKNILVVVGFFACSSTFLMTFFFGIGGALFSSFFTFLIQGILVAYYVNKRLGFTPFLQIFGR